jgi:hypothetical protein
MRSLSLSSQKDGGALSVAARKQVRGMVRKVAAANATRIAWTSRVLAELAQGPMTRSDLLAVICPNWRAAEQKALADAVRRLIALGKVRERPMIEPGGRAVRVEPVMVLELVEQGSAAA